MTRNAAQILDELLVLQSQSGNHESLSSLFSRYQQRLLHHAFKITDQHSVAQDIVQETSVVLIKRIHTLKDPAVFKSWIYRITTNKCRDWLRKQKRLSELPLENEHLPESCEDKSDQLTMMRHAITQLSADSQLIISMYYLEGMNIQEISSSLNLPAGTIKSRLYHARIKLKKLVDGD